MEHEFTINGRIFPDASQVSDSDNIKKFATKIAWAEEDFQELDLKASIIPCGMDDNGNTTKGMFMFSMASEDIDRNKLEKTCQNLSLLLGCTVALCKDHEAYGVANVFNGGSDYEVVDEDCDLWVYKNGSQVLCEHTKEWNEKLAEMEQDFLNGEAATLLSVLPKLN